MRRLTTTLVAVAALVTTSLTISATAVAATAAPGPEGTQPPIQTVKASPYVALGDSYSATGIKPLDPGIGGSECGRSSATYSHLIAAQLGVKVFRDAACGGADTSDYFHSQHPGIPRQLSALSKHTRLVTMTIGGNDQNVFGGLVTSCAIASAAERQTTGSIAGAPCKTLYRNSFRTTIRQQTYPNVVHALQAVRKRAPRATVAILGYPDILPASGVEACYSSVPISMGDVAYAHRIQNLLNKVVKRAAKKTGALYVDMSKASRGHDACQPVGTRWIEPLVGAQSTALHPNVIGHQAMAAQTLERLGLAVS
ncbi:MAG TPA: SGNH/GDSL hydrolase family protein [Nocardioides sp.]|uniref:SGNH/GDSL hydrolase family protein n=1 Tax=uncultured Nocardioides sp. TaxID=198441 RepID=UPI00261A8B44|nr:SGNH/GDSL hydrolase family protein [uncultured Nocardioides sp.]HRI95131.1 SGNH/GDSL hydrolase family protein [Nocardioides sp.]HRK44576.1 SGNH/GDSL hydrolase family protein [Nocardioides sp.]